MQIALAAICTLSVSSACGDDQPLTGSDAKGQKVVVGWNSTPDVQYLPVLMAIDSLNENGYNIETQTLSGPDVTAQALGSNRVQFSHNNVTGVANAVKQGAPIKLISTTSANPAAWVTKPEFEDCQSLDGEPVGIFGPAASSGYTKQMDLYFKKNCPGIGPKLVTIPDSALRSQALASGQIVASVLALSDAASLTEKLDPGGDYLITELKDEFPGLADNYLYANEDVIEDNPALVSALVTAELEAVRQIYDNPSEYEDLLKEHMDPETYTAESAEAALKSKTWYVDGGFDETGLSGLEDTLEVFQLPGSTNSLVERGFVDDAMDELGPYQPANAK